MNRVVLGVVIGLVLAGIGTFWWQGRAEVERGAPPPSPAGLAAPGGQLPLADASGLEGPAPPEATELTREQRRFFRYDRDRDLRITRNEMLASRSEAFRKLDADGNNLLTFEEWAVATSNKFKAADRDGNLELNQQESTATKPKPQNQPACRC